MQAVKRKYFLLGSIAFNMHKGSDEARILAWGQNSGHLLKMARKQPEFCYLARIFVFWLTYLQLIAGNDAKLGSFSQKVGKGQKIWDNILIFS